MILKTSSVLIKLPIILLVITTSGKISSDGCFNCVKNWLSNLKLPVIVDNGDKRSEIPPEILTSRSILHNVICGLERLVFNYENIVMIADIYSNLSMKHCEIIKAEQNVIDLVLQKSNETSKPRKVTFEDMMELISICARHKENQVINFTYEYNKNVNLSQSLFGPDYKWCGRSSSAENYFDLGSDTDVDKCCRAYSMCPLTVKPGENKYNITNNEEYTLSHCLCIDIFEKCLNDINSPSANDVDEWYSNAIKNCIQFD